MNEYSMTHFSDDLLARDLKATAGHERGATAKVLAQMAEFDSRRLYVPAGYSSMYLFCIEELRFSEDETYKRVRVARLAQQFPAIFPAIEDARLSMTAVLMLSTHLFPERADELLAAAANKSKAAIELLLAQRFPKPDLETLIQPIAQVRTEAPMLVPPAAPSPCQLAPERVGMTKAAQAETLAPRARIAPLAPERFALQVTIGQSAHDKLRFAQALLGHTLPSGDVAQVLERALDCARRDLHGSKPAAALPGAQSVRGRAYVWRRVHAEQARGFAKQARHRSRAGGVSARRPRSLPFPYAARSSLAASAVRSWSSSGSSFTGFET